MTPPNLISLALFLAGIAVFLIQLWFQPWNSELFLKIIITDGALFVVSFVVAFLIKEKKENDKMDKGGLD